MPMLMPEHRRWRGAASCPVNSRPSTISTTIAVAMASAVRDQLSRKPNVTWPDDQDDGDEHRREVALVEPERLPLRTLAMRLTSCRPSPRARFGRRVAQSPASYPKASGRPRRRPRRPSPKCSRRWFCAQNPEPPRPPAPAAGRSSAASTCAPIALRLSSAGSRRLRRAPALQVERDPMAARRHVVPVQQQRPALVGDDHVEHAAVPRSRRARPRVRRSDRSRRPSAPRRRTGPRRR